MPQTRTWAERVSAGQPITVHDHDYERPFGGYISEGCAHEGCNRVAEAHRDWPEYVWTRNGWHKPKRAS